MTKLSVRILNIHKRKCLTLPRSNFLQTVSMHIHVHGWTLHPMVSLLVKTTVLVIDTLYISYPYHYIIMLHRILHNALCSRFLNYLSLHYIILKCNIKLYYINKKGEVLLPWWFIFMYMYMYLYIHNDLFLDTL